jgi:hypothetical protein
VVTPGWLVLEAVGSSLLAVKAWFIIPHPSLAINTVKHFTFLYLFIAYFLRVKNTYKNPYSLKAVIQWMLISQSKR